MIMRCDYSVAQSGAMTGVIDMSKKDSGGPAYPFEYHNQTGAHQPGFFDTGMLSPGASQQFAGMTLRDYFAIRVFSASIAGGYWPIDSSREDQARMAYLHADALIAERAK